MIYFKERSNYSGKSKAAGKIHQDIYHCHSTSRTYAPLETPFSPYFRPSRSLFPLAYENNTVGGDEVLLTVKKEN